MKKNIIGGYTLTCMGDEGEFTYVKTLKENQMIDNLTLHLLKEDGSDYKVRDFINGCGSDERQYNYPGIDLHIGSLMKTRHGEFDEYHTSGDNLNFVSNKGITDSYNFCLRLINLIENNFYYVNTKLCEPQLGKYGLYNMIGASKDEKKSLDVLTFRNILFLTDGKHNILDISKKLKIETMTILKYIEILKSKNLVKKISVKICNEYYKKSI